MAQQGIWNGTISFSLVAIPVRLVRAVVPGRIAFRLLHRTDHSPLTRKMYCPQHQQLVPPEEIIRGFQITPERYLPITTEELESITPERSKTIEILDFIAIDEIDPLYFDRHYYLVPLKGGEKSYHLLAEVMRQSSKAGIARFVLAEREHVVVIRSIQGALALITLHYHHEIQPADSPAPRQSATTERKNSIKKRIKTMQTDFNPAHYADAHRETVLALLKRKAGEQKAVESPAIEEADMGPPDLVAALEEIMREVRSES